MRLEVQGGIVRITLSERNLRALLIKLAGNPANSACTLTYDTRDGLLLVVTAEPDAIHYANPERDSPVPGRDASRHRGAPSLMDDAQKRAEQFNIDQRIAELEAEIRRLRKTLPDRLQAMVDQAEAEGLYEKLDVQHFLPGRCHRRLDEAHRSGGRRSLTRRSRSLRARGCG